MLTKKLGCYILSILISWDSSELRRQPCVGPACCHLPLCILHTDVFSSRSSETDIVSGGGFSSPPVFDTARRRNKMTGYCTRSASGLYGIFVSAGTYISTACVEMQIVSQCTINNDGILYAFQSTE